MAELEEMKISNLEGFSFVDGTKEDFEPENLQENYVHFVRTKGDKSNGYIMYNGKKYGVATSLDAGEYPNNVNIPM